MFQTTSQKWLFRYVSVAVLLNIGVAAVIFPLEDSCSISGAGKDLGNAIISSKVALSEVFVGLRPPHGPYV